MRNTADVWWNIVFGVSFDILECFCHWYACRCMVANTRLLVMGMWSCMCAVQAVFEHRVDIIYKLGHRGRGGWRAACVWPIVLYGVTNIYEFPWSKSILRALQSSLWSSLRNIITRLSHATCFVDVSSLPKLIGPLVAQWLRCCLSVYCGRRVQTMQHEVPMDSFAVTIFILMKLLTNWQWSWYPWID